ncbi:ubiquitin-conjugating enzyme/RWD-like protein [Syncephalis plumigaleata]|nr:ubiquitin-conjugating enzyme/RWD-like protein [Syncephalis plumigaleata]
MTDYAEEQANELEVLSSIYPTEYEEISKDPMQFRINIVSEEKMHGSDESEVSIWLEIIYTPTYPDDLPQMRVEPNEGELNDSELALLRDTARETAEEYRGMVLVFTLASQLKETLEKIVVDRREHLERQVEEKRRQEAEEEQKKFVGTKVTTESFMTWKRAFDNEMANLAMERRKREEKNDPKRNKLTGRQLFEKDESLAASDAKFIEDDDVTVDTALFEDEEELVLTDEEDETDTVAAMLRGTNID